MTRPTYSTCRYFTETDQCRRFPPLAPDLGGASFPLVYPDTWCDEHEPKTPIVTENLT
jgi:hypothetical protein